MSAGPAIDAARVIADLRELGRRTGGPEGAKRLCWSEEWREARSFLGDLLAELAIEPEVDEAGNLWASLPGEREPALALGSHIDSVPAGGWLDGALGVMAGLGVLRAWSEASIRPPRSLVLVDWADEEGARFGRSLFGSSAFSGSLDPAEVRGLSDSEGRALPAVLAENGVELDRAPGAAARRDGLAAYLELHIEQGPVLEAERIQAAAVGGCAGVERYRFLFRGQASHAGTTPMERRRDAGLAAAEVALAVEAVGRDRGGVATTGALALRPGIPTAVAGEAELLVDLRHADPDELQEMLADAVTAAEEAASRRRCELELELVWRIAPTSFDPALVAAAREACRQAAGSDRVMLSGALHDAAEVARILPAAMVFCPSTAGISHAREEDTPEPDLAAGIEAFGLLANRLVADLPGA
ncbi:MAG TPA: Zn-dependent hydrolase [Solirubrobacterales bacterium]|nr:Zn-dependent hydrolase [Solirubrobacterales bacterium]